MYFVESASTNFEKDFLIYGDGKSIYCVLSPELLLLSPADFLIVRLP